MKRSVFTGFLIQLKYIKYAFGALICVFLCAKAPAQLTVSYNKNIQTGADKLVQSQLSLLASKKVAVCGNQTSILSNKTHLVDTLLHSGINIVKIFTPEHGLRGTADAGEKVAGSTDPKTGVTIVSLYGKNKKPTPEQLKGIDVLVFDLQDVGARFYTYISTLHYVMEACAQNNVPVIVLDRPNPNGFYVDGPVLKDTSLRSFVGMHPIPIVHGMTMGEYAQMIKGERWINQADVCALTVIQCANYKHSDYYELPVAPSPNLTTMQAIYYYPTTCLLEGTSMSVGRGTASPFRNIGMPGFKKGKNYFTPVPTTGAKDPKYKDKQCRGIFISDSMVQVFLRNPMIDLSLIGFCYDNCADKKTFFTQKGSFNILAGDKNLKKQLLSCNKAYDKVRVNWESDLNAFKTTRRKYLLYPDYE